MGETSGTATAARGTLYLLLLSIFGAIAAGGLLAAAVGDIWSGWTSRELASPFLAACSASQQCELRHSCAAPRAEREGSCRPLSIEAQARMRFRNVVSAGGSSAALNPTPSTSAKAALPRGLQRYTSRSIFLKRHTNR